MYGTEPRDAEDVGYLSPDVVPPGNLGDLLHGPPQGAGGVGAEVAGKDTIVPGNGLAQLYDLFGVALVTRGY